MNNFWYLKINNNNNNKKTIEERCGIGIKRKRAVLSWQDNEWLYNGEKIWKREGKLRLLGWGNLNPGRRQHEYRLAWAYALRTDWANFSCKEPYFSLSRASGLYFNYSTLQLLWDSKLANMKILAVRVHIRLYLQSRGCIAIVFNLQMPWQWGLLPVLFTGLSQLSRAVPDMECMVNKHF